MPTVSMTTDLGAPADLIWDLVGRFNALGEWHPLVQKSTTTGKAEGATRALKLATGGTLVERLEHVSDAERVYRYSIVDGPLPVTDCAAEIRVRDRGDGTASVEWSCSFTPACAAEADAVKAIHRLYQSGLDNLRQIFGRGP
jgi:hypothetical protein